MQDLSTLREEMQRGAFFKRLQEIFDSAIAFRSGNGEQEQWQIFFPGNAYYKSSASQRNAASHAFDTLNKKPDYYVGAPVRNEKLMVKIGAAQKHEAYGIACDEHFASFLSMLGGRDSLNMPIVECESLASPSIARTLDGYFNDPQMYVPARLNGLHHPENDDFAALKRHRLPASRADSGAHYRQILSDHRKANKQKKPSTEQKPRPVTITHLHKGFIANVDNSGLSLFVDCRTPLQALRDEIGVCGVNGAAQLLRPVDRRAPLIPGLHQIRLSDDVAQKLTQSLPLAVINDGQPTSAAELRKNLRNIPLAR